MGVFTGKTLNDYWWYWIFWKCGTKSFLAELILEKFVFFLVMRRNRTI